MNQNARLVFSKLNGIPEHVLLWLNLGLASFAAISNGGALAIAYLKPTPETEHIRVLAIFPLSIALIVVVTAVLALARVALRRTMLGVHGFILSASAIALMVWATTILAWGIPEGKFFWSAGLLSAWVCYSVFVLCRFSLPARVRSNDIVVYAPAVALLIAIPIDLGVFFRTLGA